MESAAAQEQKELTHEIATQAFDQFKQKLRTENQSIYHAQFSIMQIEVIPPDEIKFVCPTDLTATYAKEQRNFLIEYFREKTGINMIRITTEVREDKDIEAEQNVKVLSKQEIYEEMAKKNPYLARLKEGLNLGIDY